MKYLSILFLLVSFSCVKKKAIRADKDIVGTWVSDYNKYYKDWIIVETNGNGSYKEYTAKNGKITANVAGKAKYSLFEGKFYIGLRKFRVLEANTDEINNISQIQSKAFTSLHDTIFQVDRKMKLMTSTLYGSREITFYHAY